MKIKPGIETINPVFFRFPHYAAWFLNANAISDPNFNYQALRRGLRRAFGRYLGLLRIGSPEVHANWVALSKFPDVPHVPAAPPLLAAAAPPHCDRFLIVASEYFQLKSTARCYFCHSRALCCRCAPP